MPGFPLPYNKKKLKSHSTKRIFMSELGKKREQIASLGYKYAKFMNRLWFME